MLLTGWLMHEIYDKVAAIKYMKQLDEDIESDAKSPQVNCIDLIQNNSKVQLLVGSEDNLIRVYDLPTG